jgi:hypothetical protein
MNISGLAQLSANDVVEIRMASSVAITTIIKNASLTLFSIGANGIQGATGPTGPVGPTGSIGGQGSPGVATNVFNIWNNGVSLGAFPTINLQGGLIGTTGPNNSVNISSNGDIIQAGVTGFGFTGLYVAQVSGAMVKWNRPFITSVTQGALGYTSIGTAAAHISVNRSAYYQVRSKISFTGLPSGATVQMQQVLGATGAGAIGNGTPIAQSVAFYHNYGNVAADIGHATLFNSYDVYIPSGVPIETYLTYTRGSGGGSPIVLSPTGTLFEIQIT